MNFSHLIFHRKFTYIFLHFVPIIIHTRKVEKRLGKYVYVACFDVYLHTHWRKRKEKVNTGNFLDYEKR